MLIRAMPDTNTGLEWPGWGARPGLGLPGRFCGYRDGLIQIRRDTLFGNGTGRSRAFPGFLGVPGRSRAVSGRVRAFPGVPGTSRDSRGQFAGVPGQPRRSRALSGGVGRYRSEPGRSLAFPGVPGRSRRVRAFPGIPGGMVLMWGMPPGVHGYNSRAIPGRPRALCSKPDQPNLAISNPWSVCTNCAEGRNPRNRVYHISKSGELK